MRALAVRYVLSCPMLEGWAVVLVVGHGWAEPRPVGLIAWSGLPRLRRSVAGPEEGCDERVSTTVRV